MKFLKGFRAARKRRSFLFGKRREPFKGVDTPEASVWSGTTEISDNSSESHQVESTFIPVQQQPKHVVEEGGRDEMESSARVRVVKQENDNSSVDNAINLFDTFLCFGSSPLPDVAESANEATYKTVRCTDEISSAEESMVESIECIYNNSADAAVIEPQGGIESKFTYPTNDSRNVSSNCMHELPPADSKFWPQAPLLFRAAPKSGTEILGIRRDNSKDYLWTPESTQSWWNVVGKLQDSSKKPLLDSGCWILPINDGKEANGQSLVVDFQSRLFDGSLLIRLRDVPLATDSPLETSRSDGKERAEDGFFAGTPLRFQVVIRGNFRQSLQWSKLLAGSRLQRKLGKVPPKWLLWTILKVVHFFAPQLQTKLDGEYPYALSPLGSAPRTVTVHQEEPTDLLGDNREEPTTQKESLTGKAYPIKNPLERARARKKHFDQMFKANNTNFCTGDQTTYTFQFLQHLLDYHTSSIDLGSINYDMNDLLGGQPFQIMAEHDGEPLWMFEIWNENILEDAKRSLGQEGLKAK